MDRNRISTIVLISIIALLTFYVTFSANKQRREIKRLTQELKVNVDSLRNIHSAYINLEQNYKTIYEKLDSTRNKFNSFQHGLDSIMHTQIVSLSKMNKELKELLKDEKPIPPLVNLPDTFIFN